MAREQSTGRATGATGADEAAKPPDAEATGSETTLDSDSVSPSSPASAEHGPNIGTKQADRKAKGDEKPKGDENPKAEKEPKKVYEAGAVIVRDGKVVLRFTDGGNWIFPKGKLKKHESPEDAAIREAVEETGLKVEVVGQAGELIMKTDGKKRRFVFYLMRAVGTTWDWPHHEGRDTFVMDADRVGSLLRKGYRRLWASCEERVRSLIATEKLPSTPEQHDPSPGPLPDSGRGPGEGSPTSDFVG